MKPVTAQCRDCGGTIRFRRLSNGKWCPMEPNGDDHFDICAQRKMERFKREGAEYEGREDGQNVKGYRLGDKRQLIYRSSGKSIRGEQYVPLDCQNPCGLPPWETCECSFR